MNSVYTGNITLSLFGESHGKTIGIVMDGLPPGFKIDENYIKLEMNRRKPGQNKMSTPRKESDSAEIVSGLFNGCTTGAPLCGLIYTGDTKSKDYGELVEKMRPGHSDYSGAIHYRNHNDYRGGGHFSGRLTAPLVFAGSICKQYLRDMGITIGSHILKIHNVEDRSFLMEDLTQEKLELLRHKTLPVIADSDSLGVEERMEACILEARKEKDSVGGIVECVAIGLPAGWGNPFFHSIESEMASLLFSIPAVKGVSFGAGFEIVDLFGSEANDAFQMENNSIVTKTNHNGGILGGITNGMPIICKVAIKPTPSISKAQETINRVTMENTILTIEGRHDSCIIPRAIPVVESAVAITLFNAYLEDKKWS
ncbi:chorismate synthase [endosymbiont 'TC1' of Trimyema compressum]|uniref:chorismate synthase n=1 Tax=endosymbiont 'TC1' of Trimyema compressum TaxID=243899 RepID=UPI0007F066B6|nr:chorismate synthase [endosymbiont 'TC1' of Trimyema compressum]AMP19905.1 chorismate synthase [endosymbiont 'TC1' of Trimyema compressum]